MTESLVLSEVRAGIAHIILNRPLSGNALSPETGLQLGRAMHAACDDPDVRVVVLRAAGKMFCGGGDIDVFRNPEGGLQELLKGLLDPLHAAIHRLVTSGLPIVTVLNGPVGGGGIGIALCGDYVLAAQSMKLRGGYSAIGLSPDAASSWFLAHRAGATRARQIFFLNEPVSAQRCLELGIVDAVYPDHELAARADELARRLALSSTGALRRIKRLMDGMHERTLQEHLNLERDLILECATSPDASEGIAAFLEKRSPVFYSAD